MPPAIVEPVKTSLLQGMAVMAGGIAILAVPFLMGLGISALVPRTPEAIPTPLIAQAAPSPNLIAQK